MLKNTIIKLIKKRNLEIKRDFKKSLQNIVESLKALNPKAV